MNRLTHISLFTGAMGFDLGAEWAGVETIATCENDAFLQERIKNRYAGSGLIHHDNVETFNHKLHANIISAGFPCQNISVAAGSKAAGINGPASGLWKHVIRICGNVRPEYCLIENSPKILIRGFGHLIGAFSQIGYMCEWDCITNAQFGFPSERERMYLVAYPTGFGQSTQKNVRPVFSQKIPGSQGWQFSGAIGRALQGEDNGGLLRCDDGFPTAVDEIKAYGNSVNPHVAKYLFESILKHRLQFL